MATPNFHRNMTIKLILEQVFFSNPYTVILRTRQIFVKHRQLQLPSRDFCAKAIVGIFLVFVSNPLGIRLNFVSEFDASPKLAQFS